MHYYKINISDWQSSTRHLTPEEEGVYFRLINHYYDTERPIPLETQSVIRRLMLGSHSVIVQSILDEFFTKTDRGYEKEKCNEIIKEYKKTSNKNKKNGSLGGRPRKNAASKETQSVTSGLPDETQDKPTGNPNQEPLTTNQELETTIKDMGGNPQTPAPKKHKFDPKILTDTRINPASWAEWCDYRKDKRKEISKAAYAKQLKFLHIYDYQTQQEIIDYSIKDDYTGLFEPKAKQSKANLNDILNDHSWADGLDLGFGKPDTNQPNGELPGMEKLSTQRSGELLEGVSERINPSDGGNRSQLGFDGFEGDEEG